MKRTEYANMIDAAAQLVLRQDDIIVGNKLLVVNPAADTMEALQQAWPERTLVSWSLHARSNSAQQPADYFAAHIHEPLAIDGIILFLPKEKQLVAMLMANLAAMVPAGTPLWLSGHKDTGIKSQLKINHPGWASFTKLASGNHCQLIQTQLLETQDFQPEDWYHIYRVPSPGGALQISTMPGVFSAEHLDAGTELLLENMPSYVGGRILDFGCGAGVISAWLAKNTKVTELYALDASPLALTATARTLADFTVPHECIGSDGLAQSPRSLDWIITNPPFHTGKQIDYQITRDFIKKSRQCLRKNGALLLVANRFLPYRDVLETAFHKVDTIAENSRFIVWRAM